MTQIPDSHIPPAISLQADAYVDLFQIDLYSGSSLYLSPEHWFTWNGHVWESVALKLTGVASYADDQVSRPKLQIQNPDGIYSPFVSEGAFEGATVTRFRVLLDDVQYNRPIYISQVWEVARVATLTRVYITVELRTLIDKPNFILPANTYSPPKFPTVSLDV